MKKKRIKQDFLERRGKAPGNPFEMKIPVAQFLEEAIGADPFLPFAFPIQPPERIEFPSHRDDRRREGRFAEEAGQLGIIFCRYFFGMMDKSVEDPPDFLFREKILLPGESHLPKSFSGKRRAFS